MNWLKRLLRKKLESKVFRTIEIFKTSGVPEHTFVERKAINEKISDFFISKDSVLLFLGYSKSGKTVYRKQHISNSKFKTVTWRGNNESTISNLYDQIASELNLGQIVTTIGSTGNKFTNSTSSSVGVKDVSCVSGSNSEEISFSYAMTNEHIKVKVDVNFLCNKLKNENVLVVIEDYHLLNSAFNKTFSEDIKHFLDDEILFLLIGIPSSPNRALRNNPDLSGRMEHINFDYLEKEEIKQLIEKGCNKLGVEFSEDVVDEIIKVSMRNAFLVQYICRELLISNGIEETQSKIKRISSINKVHETCGQIAEKLDKDYNDIYSIILSGIRKQQDNKAFNQYEEILKAIKEFDIKELEKGISYITISSWAWNHLSEEKIQAFINNGTYQNEVSFKGSLTTQIRNAFDNINTNLERNKTRPILYVDERTIYLTDLIFKFYINWKKNVA